ncbi:hypothetical protein ACH5RR_040818 [Cinchona calisaya]|uniref:Retrotransposon gag domain-containing protein n=1 Tax=Cinchona calisaya TaxID=153742 RepID=A0ABD2XUD5_9GENT
MGKANNPREFIGYWKPYPEWIDQTYEFPRRFRFPDFTKFLGYDHESTVEHIDIFTILPYSAIRLPHNSINEWDRMEDAFHQQIYHSQLEVRFTDLAQIVQRARKMASQYVKRFKTAKMRCNAKIPKEEFAATVLIQHSISKVNNCNNDVVILDGDQLGESKLNKLIINGKPQTWIKRKQAQEVDRDKSSDPVWQSSYFVESSTLEKAAQQ